MKPETPSPAPAARADPPDLAERIRGAIRRWIDDDHILRCDPEDLVEVVTAAIGEERDAERGGKEIEIAAHRLTSATVARLKERVGALAAALMEFHRGTDRVDGKPCWCPSPTLAAFNRATGKNSEWDGHRPECGKARAALRAESDRPATPPPTTPPAKEHDRD